MRSDQCQSKGKTDGRKPSTWVRIPPLRYTGIGEEEVQAAAVVHGAGFESRTNLPVMSTTESDPRPSVVRASEAVPDADELDKRARSG